MQMPVQSEYRTELTAVFLQAQLNRGVWVSATATYLGGALGAVWDLSIPDLSAAGFVADWGLRPGAPTVWAANAYGGAYAGTGPLLLPLIDGATAVTASRSGESALVAGSHR